MSFKEVKRLREQKKIDQAYEMAKHDLSEFPDDIWSKRAMGWVLYDLLKRDCERNDSTCFKKHLNMFVNITPDDQDLMLNDHVAYLIGKFLFAHFKTSPKETDQLTTIFHQIRLMKISKPSESYSFLFKSFLRFRENWPEFRKFCEWWDFSSFAEQDYKPGHTEDGKNMMSLAEQAYIAYAKSLLKIPLAGVAHEIDNLIEVLTRMSLEYPSYQYPLYYKAKLQIKKGDGEYIKSEFIPYARRKSNEFWVWELLSGLYDADQNMRVACLVRAVMCRAKEDFLVNVRRKLAAEMIEQQNYNAAKFEIDKIVSVAEGHSYHLNRQVEQWKNSDWYQNAKVVNNYDSFYKEQVRYAEELLYADILEILIVVESVNEQYGRLLYICNYEKRGALYFTAFLKKVNPGDCLKVRLIPDADGKYERVLSMRLSDVKADDKILQIRTDVFKIPNGKDFGFFADAFVDGQTIKNLNLEHNKQYQLKLVASFNNKKAEWGWRVVGLA